MAPQDFEALAARAEAATGPDRELDAAIASAVGLPHGQDSGWSNNENGDYWTVDECAALFTASLDAAMTLAGEGERRIEFGTYENGTAWAYFCLSNGEGHEADAATEPLAVCAVLLRAKAAA